MKLFNIINPILWWRYLNLLYASILVDKEKYDKAETILKNHLRKCSVSEYHYYLLGKIYLQKKDYNMAAKCFSLAIQYNGFMDINKASAYFYLGLTYYESGNFNDAIPNFQMAIQIKNKLTFSKGTLISLPNLYCYLARSYKNLKQIGEAFESINKGLQYEPNNEALQRELTLLNFNYH